jgi:hypothetical protein
MWHRSAPSSDSAPLACVCWRARSAATCIGRAILDNDSGQIGLVPCSVLTHVVVDNTPQHDSFDIADDVIVFSATDGAAATTTAATVETAASPTTKQDVVVEKDSPEVADEQSYVVHGGDLGDIEDHIEDDSDDDPVILLQPHAKRRRRKRLRVRQGAAISG